MKKTTRTLSSLAFVLALAIAAQAQDIPVSRDNVAGAERPYSPYAGRGFPTRVFWGDTHLHTSNSLDARAVGATIGPEEAFQFARGDEVTSSHGQRAKLSRPLDFLVVSDHSDAMGAMNEIIAGNPDLMRNATLRDWHGRLVQGGTTAVEAALEVIYAFTESPDPRYPRRFWTRGSSEASGSAIWRPRNSTTIPAVSPRSSGTSGPRPRAATTCIATCSTGTGRISRAG